MLDNFAKYCIQNGGEMYPLTISSETSGGMGLCNPSVLKDDDGRLRFVLRNVNYALWHSNDSDRFNSVYGPLAYITKHGDNHLRTENYLLDRDGDSLSWKHIDTSAFDSEPAWDFVGLEDARLVRWDGRLYVTGVRRDTNTVGQGRMELCEIGEDGRELSRLRLTHPSEQTYCEKNWMPVADMPYCYVRWVSPTEVLRVDPATGADEVVARRDVPPGTENLDTDGMQIRGSSQAVPLGDGRHIAITHMCRLCYNDKKEKSDCGYWHQFVVWDAEWNVERISEPFKFAGFGIEFTTGLAIEDGRFVIPFALQDCFSFALFADIDAVLDFVYGRHALSDASIACGNVFADLVDSPYDSAACCAAGRAFFADGHWAQACVCFERALEFDTFADREEHYRTLLSLGLSFERIDGCDEHETAAYMRMIDAMPFRSEGYYMASSVASRTGRHAEAFTLARLAVMHDSVMTEDFGITRNILKIRLIEATYKTERYKMCEGLVLKMLASKDVSDHEREALCGIFSMITENKKNACRIL